MYDVAIVGAGPAGCAAAISLSRLDPELQVCLVANGTSPEMGQTLAPGAQPLIEQLGCWQSFLAAQFRPAYATRAAWGDPTPYDHDFMFGMHGNGWHLERGRFDAWLRGCVPAHIAVLRGAPPPSRFVIDASGRGAWFATRAGARRVVGDTLTAIGGMASGEADGAMVEAVSDGWWYSAPLDAGVMVILFADAESVRRNGLHLPGGFEARLRASRLTTQRIKAPVANPVVWSAASQRLNCACGADWLAVGDAASTFDPLSSAGVVKALRSGLLGSFAALDWLRGKPASLERYARLVEVEFDAYLKTRAYYYGLERRWPQSKFWAARHSANDATPRRESPQELDHGL